MKNNTGVIVIEGHVQGLSNTRSLGEKGIPVYVVDKDNCIARYSRYRLNPSLNPEREMWGTYEPEHATEYVFSYTFGRDEKQSDLGHGRGGGNIVTINRILYEFYEEKVMWGHGLKEVYGTTYGDFAGELHGISGMGSASGMTRYFIAQGTFGIISLLLLALSMIYMSPLIRLRNILFILFLFDFIFYSGIIFRNTGLAILFVFLILNQNKPILLNQDG